jgi:lipopolysaccharide exporter
MNSDEIKRKILHGLGWVGAAMIGGRVISVAASVVVTRFLAPEEFGIWAVVTAITLLVGRLSEFSMESALIQGEHCTDRMMDVAWTYRFIRNLLVTIALAAAASPLCDVFNTPEAATFLQVSCLSVFISGFGNIGLVKLRRALSFRELTITEIIAQVTFALACVVLITQLKSLWALVYAGLISAGVRVLVSYFFAPHMPKIILDWVVAKPMFGFGICLFLNTLFLTIREQGVIYYMKGPLEMSQEMLGYYNRGSAYSYMLFIQALGMFWKIAYPAFSRVAVDRAKLRIVWKKNTLIFSGLSFVGLIISCLCASPSVGYVLGEQWLPIVPVIIGFVVYSVLALVIAPTQILFQSLGKPRLGTISYASGTIAMIACGIPLIEAYGIEGAAWSFAIGQLITVIVAAWLARTVFDVSRDAVTG